VVDHAVNPPDHARRLARDRGFHAVHSIDATAKGLLARIVLVVPRERLAALDAYAGAVSPDARRIVARESRERKGFVYTERRGTTAWMFILVAEAPEETARVAEAFFASPAVKPGVFRPTP
jgi:hypothetical protein